MTPCNGEGVLLATNTRLIYPQVAGAVHLRPDTDAGTMQPDTTDSIRPARVPPIGPENLLVRI